MHIFDRKRYVKLCKKKKDEKWLLSNSVIDLFTIYCSRDFRQFSHFHLFAFREYVNAYVIIHQRLLFEKLISSFCSQIVPIYNRVPRDQENILQLIPSSSLLNSSENNTYLLATNLSYSLKQQFLFICFIA